MSTDNSDEKNVVKIKILGIGGGGNNAIDRMTERDIPMVSCISVNTDTGAFKKSQAETKIQIGLSETHGYGAGGNPEKGRISAKEDIHMIESVIKDCDMLFIVAGMGGGTGTGAAPVIAEAAKRAGILTVGVVTKPFYFEGKKRKEYAESGIELMSQFVDALIVIPNDNLKYAAGNQITLSNAFAVADSVLIETVENIVDVITKTAYINCDFADITSILENSGFVHAATGQTSGMRRAEELIEQISYNRLLESSANGADGILLCVTASGDVTLDEVDRISSAITSKSAENANVIFGIDFDENASDEIKAVLLATKKR